LVRTKEYRKQLSENLLNDSKRIQNNFAILRNNFTNLSLHFVQSHFESSALDSTILRISSKVIAKFVEKMKLFWVSIFLLSMLNAALSTETDDENCYWNYKCCVFKDTKGVISCAKMCEPEIICDVEADSNSNDAEEVDPDGPLEIRSNPCREGFQFRYGKCRKVLRHRKQK
jgi:hypothetical protein